jgi:hypothetical protein
MVARYINLNPNESKKAWPLGNPQNGRYVFCQHKNKNLFVQTVIFYKFNLYY